MPGVILPNVMSMPFTQTSYLIFNQTRIGYFMVEAQFVLPETYN